MIWKLITPISILAGFIIFYYASCVMSDASAQQGLSLISQNNATLSTYSDRDIGFNFSYPSDWTLYTNKTRLYTVASFESPDKVATVDIRIFPQGNFNSIKEYGDSRFKESGDYTLLQYYRNSSTLLSGKPAIKVVYLTTYNPSIFEKAMGYESSTSKAMMVATMVPEKKSIFATVYLADPGSFNKHLSTVEKMVKSFKIVSEAPIIQEED